MRRILDLFCAGGGASVGLHRAWPDAEVVGVDINRQSNYPFTFIQADALEYPLEGFDFIWASPPCQHYTRKSTHWGRKRMHFLEHPDLIDPVRQRLGAQATPFVIENVAGGATAPRPDALRLDVRAEDQETPAFRVQLSSPFASGEM